MCNVFRHQERTEKEEMQEKCPELGTDAQK